MDLSNDFGIGNGQALLVGDYYYVSLPAIPNVRYCINDEEFQVNFTKCTVKVHKNTTVYQIKKRPAYTSYVLRSDGSEATNDATVMLASIESAKKAGEIWNNPNSYLEIASLMTEFDDVYQAIQNECGEYKEEFPIKFINSYIDIEHPYISSPFEIGKKVFSHGRSEDGLYKLNYKKYLKDLYNQNPNITYDESELYNAKYHGSKIFYIHNNRSDVIDFNTTALYFKRVGDAENAMRDIKKYVENAISRISTPIADISIGNANELYHSVNRLYETIERGDEYDKQFGKLLRVLEAIKPKP